jgi:hypothetical protein
MHNFYLSRGMWACAWRAWWSLSAAARGGVSPSQAAVAPDFPRRPGGRGCHKAPLPRAPFLTEQGSPASAARPASAAARAEPPPAGESPRELGHREDLGGGAIPPGWLALPATQGMSAPALALLAGGRVAVGSPPALSGAASVRRTSAGGWEGGAATRPPARGTPFLTEQDPPDPTLLGRAGNAFGLPVR